MFCACEIIQLFSVVFSTLRDAPKFDFRLAINETLTNGGHYWLKKLRHVVTETRVFDAISMFPPYRHRES